jgi:HSP20 family molecular chaperone IbpA
MEDSDELAWNPDSDVYTANGKLVFCLSIPFVDSSNVNIIISQSCLTVKGARKKNSSDVSHYYKMNLNFGPFEAKFNIPLNIDRQSLSTSYTDGFYFIKFNIIA